MKDYQTDKYENFFLNLKTSRDGLAKFGDFAVAAVAGKDVDAFIKKESPALVAALAAFRTDVVARQGQGGTSQAGTNTEKTAYAAFKKFIVETDRKVLTGYLYDHPDQRDTYYPDNLGGLTQAGITLRLTRLTAYTEALEKSPEPSVLAKGPAARALLTAYAAAASTKTTARATLQDTISTLGPAATTLAEAFWNVHTAALYVHRQNPMQARRYFDYASLPNRVFPKKLAVAQ